MKPETWCASGWREWQALLASQASTLAALLSQVHTAVATMRQRQAPAARWQALAAEAERMLTAQAQGQVRLERELGELRARSCTSILRLIR